MTAHSPIGFSGAKRWLNCPGSVKLSEGIQSADTEFARHGSAAHAFGEYVLINGLDPVAYRDWWVTADGLVMKAKPNSEGAFQIDGEMVDAIRTYVDHIRSLMVEGDQLYIEVRFHLPEIHEMLFGTADAVIYSPSRRLVVILDLKYGIGVVVDVVGNEQVIGYGIGAAIGEWEGRDNPIGPIQTVELVIVQPRAYHAAGPVRSASVAAVELVDWIETFREGVAAAFADGAPFKLGEWCRFCPAAAICPLQISEVQEKMPEIPKGKYEPQVLADALAWVKLAKARIKVVEAFAESEAINQGVKIPGYKIVMGEGHRQFIDETKAIAVLVKEGYDTAQILTEPVAPSLKSPAQVEEVLGKSTFAALLADLVQKPETRKQLAPLKDRRPEVAYDARAGFEPVLANDDPFN